MRPEYNKVQQEKDLKAEPGRGAAADLFLMQCACGGLFYLHCAVVDIYLGSALAAGADGQLCQDHCPEDKCAAEKFFGGQNVTQDEPS